MNEMCSLVDFCHFWRGPMEGRFNDPVRRRGDVKDDNEIFLQGAAAAKKEKKKMLPFGRQ